MVDARTGTLLSRPDDLERIAEKVVCSRNDCLSKVKGILGVVYLVLLEAERLRRFGEHILMALVEERDKSTLGLQPQGNELRERGERNVCRRAGNVARLGCA